MIALVYVHQQIELVKLSYVIDYKERKLEYILDHKDNLEYNINDLEAPSRLEKSLVSRKIDVFFPKKGQIVKVVKIAPANIRKASLGTVGIERKVNRFGIFEFFGLSREAQAEER